MKMVLDMFGRRKILPTLSFLCYNKDQYMQRWHAECSTNVKLNHYCMFKTNFHVEKYTYAFDIDKYRKCLANFRSSSHSLMIEKGRHIGIDREHRSCFYCETVLENEFHFMIVCQLYDDIRLVYIPLYYYQFPSYTKFYSLMSSENETLIRNTAMYIYNAMLERENFLKCYD